VLLLYLLLAHLWSASHGQLGATHHCLPGVALEVPHLQARLTLFPLPVGHHVQVHSLLLLL
jgi:hypothetical protein